MVRTHKLGEADRIITLLSRNRGKIRGVARGVRRTSSKFGGTLEPFSHVDVQLVEGRSLDIVTQVVQLHAYGEPLIRDYAGYTAGQVMLECADKLVVVEGEPAYPQYRLLQGALATLGRGTGDGPRPATMILDSYLLRALSTAGYAPSLDACAICGEPGPHDFFNPSSGGVVCSRCRPPASAMPGPEVLSLLVAYLTGRWEDTREASVRAQRTASGLTAAFVNWHLEHSLRSLPLVERDDGWAEL